MKKNLSTPTNYKVVLCNPDNRDGYKLYTIVTAYTEDKAMEVALRKYNGFEVYDVVDLGRA